MLIMVVAAGFSAYQIHRMILELIIRVWHGGRKEKTEYSLCSFFKNINLKKHSSKTVEIDWHLYRQAYLYVRGQRLYSEEEKTIGGLAIPDCMHCFLQEKLLHLLQYIIFLPWAKWMGTSLACTRSIDLHTCIARRL